MDELHDGGTLHDLACGQIVKAENGNLTPPAEVDSPLGSRRGGRTHRTRWFGWQRRQFSNYGHACVDQDCLLIAERIGVELLVASVEGVRHLTQQIGARPINPVKIDSDLEDLLPVSHIGRAAHANVAFKPRIGQPTPALGLSLFKYPPKIVRRECASIANVSAGKLVAQIGRQHTPSREHSREPRHYHPSQIELPCYVGDVQAGRTTEGEQREPSRVDAAAHRNQPYALRHAGVDHPMDAFGRTHSVDAERVSDPVHRGFGRLRVEWSPTAEEACGVKVAEHQIRVRDRRYRAASAIAGGSRHRSRTLGPDVEDATRINARDRAATGPDAHDV